MAPSGFMSSTMPAPREACDRCSQCVRTRREIDPLAPIAGDWWTLLGDPVLNELEARALVGNPGVAAARARIEQARASSARSAPTGYPPWLRRRLRSRRISQG